jgi:hypothetical protein
MTEGEDDSHVPTDAGRRWPQPDVVRFAPEFLEWARQQVGMEEVMAALREIETNGGISSEELLSALDDEPQSGKARTTTARKYSFKELMRGVTAENIHREVKTGPSVGREAL